MDYDAQGNLASARLYGNLSGHCEFPLVIMGMGAHWIMGSKVMGCTGPMTAITMSLLLSVAEDNGNTVNNLYDPTTKLLSAELTSDSKTIYKRRFFEYDGSGKTISIITDNGNSQHASDVEGITNRCVTTFTYLTDGPAAGSIEEDRRKTLPYCLRKLLQHQAHHQPV